MHTLAGFLAGLAFSLGAVLDAGLAALVAAPPLVFATLEARVSLVPSDASASAARFLGGISLCGWYEVVVVGRFALVV